MEEKRNPAVDGQEAELHKQQENAQEQELSEEQKAPAAEEANGREPKKKALREAERKVRELQEKLTAAEKDRDTAAASLAKEKDDYLRLMAEFDNFRRRTSQEKLELVSVAASDTIKGLLSVLDDCERAMKVLSESNDSDAAKEGTALIYNKLMDYLKSKGLAVIEAMGKEFDTDLHEAVAKFPAQEEGQKGKVFDVVQTGYTLNGKVIRFAKVVVAC